MKSILFSFVALVATAFASSAGGIDTYSRSDFRFHSSDNTHELKLAHPLEFGDEDWSIRLQAIIGDGFYTDKQKQSWGSTILVSGSKAFPEHFEDKPFQLFLRISNAKDSAHVWGGIPILDAQGKATVDGITHVLANEETKDTAQLPKAGEKWEFVIRYKADSHTLSSSACAVREKGKQKKHVLRKNVSNVHSRIEYLSTSVIGLDKWELGTITIVRGKVSKNERRMAALRAYVKEKPMNVALGGAAVVALLVFTFANSRRKKH